MPRKSLDTNATFAASDELFRAACEVAGIKPTSRQASKWRSGRGLAAKFRTAATLKVQEKFARAMGGGQ